MQMNVLLGTTAPRERLSHGLARRGPSAMPLVSISSREIYTHEFSEQLVSLSNALVFLSFSSYSHNWLAGTAALKRRTLNCDHSYFCWEGALFAPGQTHVEARVKTLPPVLIKGVSKGTDTSVLMASNV